MPRTTLLHPATTAEAVEALSRRGAVPLAGATDLIPAMRRGETAPRTLVNLKAVAGLEGVRRTRSGIRIGAITKVADLLDDPIVARDLPLIAEVARDFASVQIRNLATIGGNLCNAAPSADFAPPLLALDARLVVEGPQGVRELPITEFFRGVNKTALCRGDILTAVIVPRPRARTGAAHAKLGVRRAMDLALVGVAAAVRLGPDRRSCREARLALGSVAPVPLRALKAEALLEGQAITDDLIAEAAAVAASETRPITDLRASADYRREMAAVLARRVLREAVRLAERE